MSGKRESEEQFKRIMKEIKEATKGIRPIIDVKGRIRFGWEEPWPRELEDVWERLVESFSAFSASIQNMIITSSRTATTRIRIADIAIEVPPEYRKEVTEQWKKFKKAADMIDEVDAELRLIARRIAEGR